MKEKVIIKKTQDDISEDIKDYLANYFDLPFSYKGLEIYFGEGIHEGNIYLHDGRIYASTKPKDCLKLDGEPIVFAAYEYELLDDGNIEITFEYFHKDIAENYYKIRNELKVKELLKLASLANVNINEFIREDKKDFKCSECREKAIDKIAQNMDNERDLYEITYNTEFDDSELEYEILEKINKR